MCRPCYDDLSGASGSDSDDDILYDDDVSYLTIDDGDDSDRNDNDSNETNDDGDGSPSNRNDVQLLVPVHEHGVAAGSTGGQGVNGTPSSSDEAEGRQDAAALARMTTSAPDKGTLVWVAQGRNVNMAEYLGDIRRCDRYVLVKWESTKSEQYVDLDDISVVVLENRRGRRRRHQQQLPNPNQERAREGAARENNQIDDDHDGVADVSFEDGENENETSYGTYYTTLQQTTTKSGGVWILILLFSRLYFSIKH